MIPLNVWQQSQPNLTHGYVGAEVLFGRKTWLLAIRHLLTKTYKVLLNHNWNLVKAPPGISWLTSDNPVIKLNYYGNNEYDFKGGWGNNNTDILFPLSPKYLLHTQIGSKEHLANCSSELAKTINRYIAEHAYRIVFSEKPIKNIETFRKRLVDADVFKFEQLAWQNWHDYHTESEDEYKCRLTNLWGNEK